MMGSTSTSSFKWLLKPKLPEDVKLFMNEFTTLSDNETELENAQDVPEASNSKNWMHFLETSSGNISVICKTEPRDEDEEIPEQKYDPSQNAVELSPAKVQFQGRISNPNNIPNDAIPPSSSQSWNRSVIANSAFVGRTCKKNDDGIKNVENGSVLHSNIKEATRRSKRINKPTYARDVPTVGQKQHEQPHPIVYLEPTAKSKSKNESITATSTKTQKQDRQLQPKGEIITTTNTSQLHPFVSIKRLSDNQIRSLTKKRQWSCPHCPKTFGYRSHWNAHLRFHTGERYFKCPCCPYTATANSILKIHVYKVHLKTDLPLFKCILCQEGFKWQKDLIKHMKTHGGFKCYFCPHTCKDFTTSLLAHMRIHTGETPFKCHSCSYSSKTAGHLKWHLKTVHGKK